jgi:hypothetical protein
MRKLMRKDVWCLTIDLSVEVGTLDSIDWNLNDSTVCSIENK